MTSYTGNSPLNSIQIQIHSKAHYPFITWHWLFLPWTLTLGIPSHSSICNRKKICFHALKPSLSFFRKVWHWHFFDPLYFTINESLYDLDFWCLTLKISNCVCKSIRYQATTFCKSPSLLLPPFWGSTKIIKIEILFQSTSLPKLKTNYTAQITLRTVQVKKPDVHILNRTLKNANLTVPKTIPNREPFSGSVIFSWYKNTE